MRGEGVGGGASLGTSGACRVTAVGAEPDGVPVSLGGRPRRFGGGAKALSVALGCGAAPRGASLAWIASRAVLACVLEAAFGAVLVPGGRPRFLGAVTVVVPGSDDPGPCCSGASKF